MHFSKFSEAIELPRGDRLSAIQEYASRFAEALTAQIIQAPLQWFNFYLFWSGNRKSESAASGLQGGSQ